MRIEFFICAETLLIPFPDWADQNNKEQVKSTVRRSDLMCQFIVVPKLDLQFKMNRNYLKRKAALLKQNGLNIIKIKFYLAMLSSLHTSA